MSLLTFPIGAEARTGPPLQPFPHQQATATGPVSDGARYFVLNVAPGTIRIYDTERRRARDVAVGETCTARGGTPGFALVACRSPGYYGGEGPPYALRLHDGKLRPPPDYGQQSPAEYWLSIGRQWVIGRADTGGGKPVTIFVNWRSGERASDPDNPGIGHYDLDMLKLTPYPAGVFDRDGSLALSAGGDGLWLRRRGRDARLSTNWAGATLSAGLVTWSEPVRGVRAYDERNRVRLGWIVPDSTSYPRILHTRKHVLVAAGQGQDIAPRLLWARVRK